MSSSHKCYLGDYDLPSRFYLSPRHQFVMSSEKNAKVVHELLLKVFDSDIASMILSNVYSFSEKCDCRWKWTCALCSYACCERAFRGRCMCTVQLLCPKHGITCVGNHD